MCYLVRSGQVGKGGGSAMLWKRGVSTIISDRLRLTDWNVFLCCYGVLNQLYPRL